MAETKGMPNATEDISENNAIDYDRIFTEVFAVVGLMAIFTNFLLVFTILKFIKLRNVVTNLLLVHLNIVEVIFFVVTPLTVRVHLTFQFFYHFPGTVLCSLYGVEYVLWCAVVLFLILLILDGHLKLYHHELYQKFVRMYKFFTGAIYILVICFCSIGVSACSQNNYIIYYTFLTLFVIGPFILLLIIMNIVHLVKKQKLPNSNINSTNLGLVTSNIFFILWIPIVVVLTFEYVYQRYSPLILIVLFTFGFSCPIFNFFFILKYYSDFNIFLKLVIKCQCSKYSNETLVEYPVNYSSNNGVTMSVK